ncbi:MAG TPA: DUF4403 family protein [Holophagaceae bacterium]|nr:DUF4403 family protein [Holophagaceae bacterium]
MRLVRTAALAGLAAALAGQTPAPALPPAAPAEIPASSLALPVRVDLDPIFRQVDAQAPVSPPQVETWAPIPGKPLTYARYNLVREPLSIALHDDRLRVRTVCRYGLDLGLKGPGFIKTVGSCGRSPESPRRVLVELRTQLGLTPQWGLELKDTKAEASLMDRCAITFMDVDITDQVSGGMQDALKTAAEELGRQVRENSLVRDRAQQAWNLLQQPQELQKGVILLMRPEKIRLGPFHTEGRTLVLSPEILARPLVVVGAPPPQEARPLPDLELAAPAQPGFRVDAETLLPYTDATLQMTGLMQGRRFDTGKGQVEIRTVALDSAPEGKVLVELDLAGAFEGVITLVGQPVITPEGALRLEGLDYTLESQSRLMRVGSWLFHGKLKALLQEKVDLAAAAQFKDLQAQVQTALNRPLAPGLSISGSLRAMKVDRVEAGPEAFRLFAHLEGEAKLEVR